MLPSFNFRTSAGANVICSTTGPRSLSTFCRFSSLLFMVLERDCSVSISADTVLRSFWNPARYVSTDFRMSSHSWTGLVKDYARGSETYSDRFVQIDKSLTLRLI